MGDGATISRHGVPPDAVPVLGVVLRSMKQFGSLGGQLRPPGLVAVCGGIRLSTPCCAGPVPDKLPGVLLVPSPVGSQFAIDGKQLFGLGAVVVDWARAAVVAKTATKAASEGDFADDFIASSVMARQPSEFWVSLVADRRRTGGDDVR